MQRAKEVGSNDAPNPRLVKIRARGLRLALVASICIVSLARPSFADDSDVDTRTVNGHKVELVQVGQGDYRVRVDGKEVIKKEPAKAELDIVGVYTGPGQSYLVVSRTAFKCGMRYQAIDLSGETPIVSPPMGTCSGPPKIDVVNGVLQLAFPTRTGKSLVASFPANPAIGAAGASQ
jgi:hypothetical protein